MKNLLINRKDALFSTFVILICLTLSYFFPTDGNFQNFSRGAFFFLIIPALYVKVILKKNLRDFGLNFTGWRQGLFWITATLAAALLTGYGLVQFTDFEHDYISLLPVYAMTSFRWFLVYELIFFNILLILLEIFFNGFVLFSFLKDFGYWSILIVTTIFLGFLALTNSLDWRMAPAMILIPFGAWTAIQTRSFVYAYLMGILFIIIFDAYVIYIFK
ncbi:MAG: hypothetical protein A2Z52_01170 [Candidatus Moranbacteria bacterium RBG_19FT_COMBO_42_6]|nr:MAG: hypothetical protein A2Z52_01170 [Candidatus Moranbacteria bacterium RBG_19FT_COMBO_42_6]